MATATVKIDGRELPVPDDIARDDAKLRAALTPFYPEMANADIRRETKDGIMTVSMVKRAGTKGSPELPLASGFSQSSSISLFSSPSPSPSSFITKVVIDELGSLPEILNPAVVMAWDFIKEADGNIQVFDEPERFLTQAGWLERIDVLQEAGQFAKSTRQAIDILLKEFKSSALRSQPISNPKNIPLGF